MLEVYSHYVLWGVLLRISINTSWWRFLFWDFFLCFEQNVKCFYFFFQLIVAYCNRIPVGPILLWTLSCRSQSYLGSISWSSLGERVRCVKQFTLIYSFAKLWATVWYYSSSILNLLLQNQVPTSLCFKCALWTLIHIMHYNLFNLFILFKLRVYYNICCLFYIYIHYVVPYWLLSYFLVFYQYTFQFSLFWCVCVLYLRHLFVGLSVNCSS